jgi:signal transduction histidine kinase/phage shock protein PspC (stress-responsive transcriptional regulator)
MATTSRSHLRPLPSGLARRPDERVVAGVCAGIARWLGVDPIVVRLAVAILALANGVGVLAYLVAWLALPEAPAVAGSAHEPRSRAQQSGWRRAQLVLAVGCITLGVLVLVRWSAPIFPDFLVWPATIAGLGFGLVLARGEGAGRRSAHPVAWMLGGRWTWARVLAGTVLLVLGTGAFLATTDAFAAAGNFVLAVVATAVGVGLMFGPWIVRLVRQLGDERRERIRSEERADMAAHLHDSVLQTLALIQRHAGAPDEARSLARRQERELRAWLYDDRRRVDGDGTTDAGSEASGPPSTLAGALARLTDDVEGDHRGVEVDVVLVGDCPLDNRVTALVQAMREAVVNAAKHSGESQVSVYVEVDGDGIEAFVRDRGRGFDPSAVDGDRRGITHSIVGRMTRHGGRAEVHSAPGEGTEVVLAVARAPEEVG